MVKTGQRARNADEGYPEQVATGRPISVQLIEEHTAIGVSAGVPELKYCSVRVPILPT